MSDPMRLTVLSVGTYGLRPAVTVTVDDDGVEYPIPVTREQAKIAAPHLYETVRVTLHFEGEKAPHAALVSAARRILADREAMEAAHGDLKAWDEWVLALCMDCDALTEALQALDMAEIIGKEGK